MGDFFIFKRYSFQYNAFIVFKILNMNEQKKIRVVAYIDGFNFYHSIAHNLPQKYKWMDYKAVVSKFLAENEEVTDIFLFTALPKWDTLKIQRHNTFMSVMVAN